MEFFTMLNNCDLVKDDC